MPTNKTTHFQDENFSEYVRIKKVVHSKDLTGLRGLTFLRGRSLAMNFFYIVFELRNHWNWIADIYFPL